MYPVLDKTLFRSTWPQLYDQTSTTSDRDLLSVFYLVVAIGEVNRKSPAAGETFYQLYQKCWATLQDCLAVPNVSTVQILLLHVSKEKKNMQSCLPPRLMKPRSSSTSNAARGVLLGSSVDSPSVWRKRLGYTGEVQRTLI